MTPTTDDNGQWLSVAQGVIAILLAALAALYWRLWASLASKLYVIKMLDEMKKEIQDEDQVHDLSLANSIAQIIAEQKVARGESKLDLDNYRRELGQRIDRLEDRLINAITDGERKKMLR